MSRGSRKPSPPLSSSPGSLSRSSSSKATSASLERASPPLPPPPLVVLTLARGGGVSPTRSLSLPSPLPSAPIPTSTTLLPPLRIPLADSTLATRPRALSAVTPPSFTPVLSDEPQELDDQPLFTSFDFPPTPQQPASISPTVGGPANLLPARTRRQSQKPFPSDGLTAGPGVPTAASNQLEAKVVILGSQGVGKTSIVHRYTSGAFSNRLPSTVGASFLTKRLVVDGCKVRLQLWDTAGQERFRSMAPLYYRGALAAILVYDITSMDSFNDVKVWLDELRRNMSPSLIISVVGSKVDLARTHRAVDLDYARRTVAEWVMHGTDRDDSHSNAPSRETSPSRPRTISTMSTRPSLPIITTTHTVDPPAPSPSFGARVRGMSISTTSILSSSASSISDAASGHTVSAAASEGMVRSGSMLGISLGLSKISSRGRKDPEEEQRVQEALERERVEKMVRECGVEVSEVSGKDDIGIEELILNITSQLVQRKVQIESDRVLRSRDSFMLHDPESTAATSSGGICC